MKRQKKSLYFSFGGGGHDLFGFIIAAALHLLSSTVYCKTHDILGLSWRGRVPNTSVLQATGSYGLINHHRASTSTMVMCAGRRTTACQSKLCIASYTMTSWRPKVRFRDVFKRSLNTYSITYFMENIKKSFLEDCGTPSCSSPRTTGWAIMMMAMIWL